MMTDDLSRHGVLGQIVDTVPPYVVNVDYADDACVHMGNQLGPNKTRFQPHQVKWVILVLRENDGVWPAWRGSPTFLLEFLRLIGKRLFSHSRLPPRSLVWGPNCFHTDKQPAPFSIWWCTWDVHLGLPQPIIRVIDFFLRVKAKDKRQSKV